MLVLSIPGGERMSQWLVALAPVLKVLLEGVFRLYERRAALQAVDKPARQRRGRRTA
jgi:hypothetical protein